MDYTKTPAGVRPIVIVPQLHDVVDRLDAIRLRGLELTDARAARRAARGRELQEAPPTGLWSLLVSGERGGFQSYGHWRNKLMAAQTKSGIYLTAHDLRHVAASILFASGASWRTIQQQMGHASVKETERIYGHVFHDDKSAVARMLGLKITELQQAPAVPDGPDTW
ncbi:tyrosine recombinase XerD [mine drainage metagenome]|uniref:Tyrosine recombinase XerD n=1 Tax=mine drainage metagenome TaxID=410659 RepID=A0A1J5QT17_9ZZZZ